MGELLECKAAAQKLLDAWQSPEWETKGRPIVKWDKEQLSHLWAKLGSCE